VTVDVAPKPIWVPLWLACQACKHEWDDWQPCRVPVEVWAASMEAQHCPKCGEGLKRINFRSTPIGETT
jgi:hypothetical protein